VKRFIRVAALVLIGSGFADTGGAQMRSIITPDDFIHPLSRTIENQRLDALLIRAISGYAIHHPRNDRTTGAKLPFGRVTLANYHGIAQENLTFTFSSPTARFENTIPEFAAAFRVALYLEPDTPVDVGSRFTLDLTGERFRDGRRSGFISLQYEFEFLDSDQLPTIGTYRMSFGPDRVPTYSMDLFGTLAPSAIVDGDAFRFGMSMMFSRTVRLSLSVPQLQYDFPLLGDVWIHAAAAPYIGIGPRGHKRWYEAAVYADWGVGGFTSRR
jgi:hypothetical protein